MSARPPARILIVEDTIQFADLVRVALRNLDAEIVHVMSASAALITIEQFHPDLGMLFKHLFKLFSSKYQQRSL